MRSMVEGPPAAAGGLRPPPLHPSLRERSPSPSELGEDFCGRALRLAGLAGLVFGWTPDTFWNATPAELAALVSAARGESAEPPGAAEIARLKELFPDG
ncbi:phage tail assembly chaperone [Sphingomonas sp. S2-65]|uniref:phage tail assembly chaperone n=1 Tax=Sphingomonas sp. S2-65 TaxID=2903960 RepID=UPI0039B6FBD3